MGLFNLFNNNTALEQELDEAREKMKRNCEAIVKGVEALRKSFEEEVVHNAD